MDLGVINFSGFADRLNSKAFVITRPFRDFMMQCLKEHRAGNSGDFNAFASFQYPFSCKVLIAKNTVAARFQTRGKFFNSYWEIPKMFTGNGEKTYFLVIFTKIGCGTEFSLVSQYPYEVTAIQHYRDKPVLRPDEIEQLVSDFLKSNP